jgi:hypothetical protein
MRRCPDGVGAKLRRIGRSCVLNRPQTIDTDAPDVPHSPGDMRQPLERLTDQVVPLE